jgi:hypothetical protein
MVLASLAFSGCEKVIQVDLNKADKRLVIEAILTDRDSGSFVRLTETVDYFGKNVFPGVTDAVVTITHTETARTDTLRHSGKGLYLKAGLKGLHGNEYTLRVAHRGSVYTSSSRMQKPVSIDSLLYTDQRNTPFAFHGDSGYYVTCRFKDDPAVENYYRINVEGKRNTGSFHGRMRSYHLLNDRFSNGEQVDYFLFDQTYDRGDLVKVELLSTDKAVYNYLITLERAINNEDGLSTASPANPETNIRGGALGYFAVYSSSVKSVTIK